jgi:hypothetical protein
MLIWILFLHILGWDVDLDPFCTFWAGVLIWILFLHILGWDVDLDPLSARLVWDVDLDPLSAHFGLGC